MEQAEPSFSGECQPEQAGEGVCGTERALRSSLKICSQTSLAPKFLIFPAPPRTALRRGQFEGRAVAVKRLLRECFGLVRREVQLLQESDRHPNVLRYFCTERGPQFHYIALELCRASLQEVRTSPGAGGEGGRPRLCKLRFGPRYSSVRGKPREKTLGLGAGGRTAAADVRPGASALAAHR